MRKKTIMAGKKYVIIFACGFGGEFRMPIHETRYDEIPMTAGRM